MARIKGVTVTLVEKILAGTDDFDRPVYTDKDVAVDNVLVAPVTADDVIDSTDLTGRKAVYTLAIPKGDTNDWENKEVKFFGQRWRVFGIPTEGIDNLIPLDWNKKVMVERYE